jgi:Domain of unknown function (DUF5050)
MADCQQIQTQIDSFVRRRDSVEMQLQEDLGASQRNKLIADLKALNSEIATKQAQYKACIDSTPPAEPLSTIYFQGTDDKLWRTNSNGADGKWLGGYKTKSTPCVYGEFIYFQGTDDKLWRINLDGSGGTNFAGHKAKSTPRVHGGRLYFQGTDNKLWRVELDGSGSTRLGGYDTQSSPFVSGAYVYFQGTDNKLWRIRVDGSDGVNLGLFQAKSRPFASDKYVFFQGTDNKLWRINLDGTNGIHLGGYATKSAPSFFGGYVFFQGTDDKLWRIDQDGANGTNLGGYKAKSTPAVDGSEKFVVFQGTDNKLWRLNLDGSQGAHLGGFDTASTPFVVEPPAAAGVLRPRYMVLTVVYAPPGTKGGQSNSTVEYGAGSSTGTKTSISSSFKAGVEVSASVGNEVNGGSADFKFSKTSTDSSSFEVKKNQGSAIKALGPGKDGINHDEDQIYLWLNPEIVAAIDTQNDLNFTVGVDGASMKITYVHAGWLKNPASMPPGQQQLLSAAGLTASDFATILALDPFANGATAIDSNRYLPTTFSFPYLPPFSASDSVPTLSYNQQNTLTYVSGHSVQTEYEVAVTAMAGIKDKFGLKSTSTLTWTCASSTETTNESTQSASVTVGGPAFGYTGPTDVEVYWDTMFNSFMFAFAKDTPAIAGQLKDHGGKALAHTPLTFSTFTGPKGEYSFHHVPAGSATLLVRGEHFPVLIGSGAGKTILQLTK